MICIVIKPAKRFFGGRRQWAFEIRAANGRLISDRDTYTNRPEAVAIMEKLIGSEPVELVVKDRFGEVEERRRLR